LVITLPPHPKVCALLSSSISFLIILDVLQNLSSVVSVPRDSVDHYGLYIAEDDGDVDCDFPCLDPRETVGKFGFNYLALVECLKKDEDSKSLER